MTTAEFTRAIRTVDRLVDVARLGLEREAEHFYLRDVVDAVAARLGTPFVVIDVLLNDAQLILAGYGPMPEWIEEVGGTPLEWAFCPPLVVGRVPRVVADLTADPFYKDNPLVTLAGIRAYVGAPLISHTGQVLGGLCGLDVRPRGFGEDEITFLWEQAAEVVDRIEERAGG